MIPRAHITAWRTQVPWPSDAQVEQDLVMSRALVEMYARPAIAESLAFRGGTALHKLHFKPSGQLKMKQKSNNLAGLQLADLIAHPSRNEILNENGHPVTIAPFAAKIIAVLQGKYDRRGDRVFGKKML
jgi:hypothetical protein